MQKKNKTTIGIITTFLSVGLILGIILPLVLKKSPISKEIKNIQISIGTSHSSLLTEDGRLFMWGSNNYGQLGNGTEDNSNIPIEITHQFVDEDNYVNLTNAQISMGEHHSSLLTEDGRLFMWGWNFLGQLGNGRDNNENTPIEITDKFNNTNLTNAQILMGGNHSSLLTEDGRMFVWGYNFYGQLGNGENGGLENKPIEITNQFDYLSLKNSKISMGTSHSSLLTEDGIFFMWGNNKNGQLGDGTEEDKNSPTDITNQFINEEENQLDLTNSTISLGLFHSSLLTEDGRLFMWGFGGNGQLGNGSDNNKNTPTEITDQFLDNDKKYVDLTNSKISLGWHHSALLTNDGRLFMWGLNVYGQLGNGETKTKNTPQEITDQFIDKSEQIDLTNSEFSLGGDSSSLLTNDGRLFMWGLNNHGQLGDETNNSKSKPTEITAQFIGREYTLYN